MSDKPGHLGNIDADITRVRIEAEPTFASEAREQWRQIRIMTKNAYGFSSVADLDFRVNAAAERLKDSTGRWPTALELWGDTRYQRSVEVLASGTPFLPPLFRVDDIFYRNDPLEGPSSVHPLAEAVTIGARRLRGTPAQRRGDIIAPRAPTFSGDDFVSILAGLSPIKAPRAGGGGGGAGRAPIVFDRAELREGATERWRGMLLEDADESAIDRLINDYIKDANAFWMKEAGRRDFDTFVVDRIRQQSRYDFLYARKPGFQSETEYLSGFRQVAGQLGLNASATLREVEAGASTGVGLAGFGERLSGIREVRVANAGAFSQRIAASAGQMGLTRT